MKILLLLYIIYLINNVIGFKCLQGTAVTECIDQESVCSLEDSIPGCLAKIDCSLKNISITDDCHTDWSNCCCITDYCNQNQATAATMTNTEVVYNVHKIQKLNQMKEPMPVASASQEDVATGAQKFATMPTTTDQLEEETTTKEPFFDSTKIIIFSCCGGAILLASVSAIIFCCIKKRRNRSYKPMDNERLGMDIGPEEMMKNDLIEQEDCSNIKIEGIVPNAVKAEIIQDLANPPSIKKIEEIGEPRFTKVVTYSCSDTITLSEEIAYSPFNDSEEEVVSVCEQVLIKLLYNGPRQYAFEVEQVKDILARGKRMFAKEPTLLEVPVPCTIYGDIHGQYSDLLRWFNLNGWPNRQRTLFLGDFVDRGSHGVEVVLLITCLKLCFPDNVFVCRGNHEEEGLNKAYSFYEEVKTKFKEADPARSDSVYAHFKALFSQLPLAARIGQKILGMHGGISPKLQSMANIRDIIRPIDEFKSGTLPCDIVWSDPDTVHNKGEYRPNLDREPKKGIGQLFSSHAVKETCKRLDIQLIIRGHQAPLHGYAQWADGFLITLFSAPGYKGKLESTVNMGASIVVKETGELIIKQIKVTEEFRKKRIEDCERRKNKCPPSGLDPIPNPLTNDARRIYTPTV